MCSFRRGDQDQKGEKLKKANKQEQLFGSRRLYFFLASEKPLDWLSDTNQLALVVEKGINP